MYFFNSYFLPSHRLHQFYYFVCTHKQSLTLAAAKPSTTSSRSITLCMSSLSLCSASMICSCTCVSWSPSVPLSGLCPPLPPLPPEVCCPACLPLLYKALPRHRKEITAADIIMVPSCPNPIANLFSTYQALPSNHASFRLFLVPFFLVVVHFQPPHLPAQHLAGSPGGQVCGSHADSARCTAQELPVCKRQVKWAHGELGMSNNSTSLCCQAW